MKAVLALLMFSGLALSTYAAKRCDVSYCDYEDIVRTSCVQRNAYMRCLEHVREQCSSADKKLAVEQIIASTKLAGCDGAGAVTVSITALLASILMCFI